MRYLLLTLLMSFAGLLSAQCSIDVDVESVTCDPETGLSVVTFFISGTSDTLWFSPTVDISGGYDSDGPFTTPPFNLQNVDGLIFIDASGNCETFVEIDNVCGLGGCENLSVTIEVEQATPCASEELQTWLVSLNSGVFPVTAEYFDGQNNLLETLTFDQVSSSVILVEPNDVYNVVFTDADGCTYTETFFSEVPECGSVTGRSWLDENGNGLQDPDETTVVGATVTLRQSGGNQLPLDSQDIGPDGTYFFSFLQPFEGYVITIETDEADRELTLFNVGNDPTIDNDFSPIINSTGVFIGNSGVTITQDAGWRAAPCTPLEVNIVRQGDFCTENLRLIAEAGNSDGPFTFAWNTGENTQLIVPQESNLVYSVTVTDAEGCSGVAQVFVSASSLNDTIDVPDVVTLDCDGGPTTITIANPIEGFTYNWFGGQNEPLTGTSITVDAPGFFEIEGRNDADCFYFGFTQVQDLRLDNVGISGFGQDSICGLANCFGLTNVWQFNNSNISVIWDGPPEFDEEFGNGGVPIQQFCGVPEGIYTATVMTACDTVVLTYDNNNLECSEITGTLYLDAAGDCDLDGDDLPAPGFIITLTNEVTGEMYYAWTGSNGNWSVELPNGVYTIEPIIEPGQPLTTCPATTVSLNGNAVTGVQIFMPVLESCPVLTTEVTIPFLRRCFTGCAYVNYENTGTATGEDAQVVVVLDPFFIDVVPSVDPVSVVGNVYTFNLGDLPPFSNGSIGFIFTVSCEAELGQSHCIDASITPDDPCGADPAWNGALVDITNVVCEGDSVRFTVTNIGDSQMSVPLSYVIVEDGIMLSADPFTNGLLEPGEDYLVAVEAEGGTIALITNQEPNAPGSEEPSLVFEGCNGNGETFTTGFTNLLPLSSGNPSRSIVCRENVGSYDPNDKMGYPLGWGDANIAPGTRLDYEIRFQNTGTDTAFTVVISDTLSAALDLATFKMEATSHPVSVAIDTFRVVTWTFNNILLPDSTTNLLLSQGSIVFSIDHAASLEGGDEILNEAAIYFDFNEPVITNVSRHVIAKDGLPTSVRSVAAQSVNLSVFPNPVADLLKVNVPAREVRQDDLVTVTDLHGRPLLTKPYRQVGQGLDVSSLPTGYYLLLLTDESGRARGRVPFVVTAR